MKLNIVLFKTISYKENQSLF